MQLPVEQFPILTAGQMNPFHQALQSGLENYQNNMKTAYMPYAYQADIASKQAYANNYARQIAATVLGNPLAVASMMQTDTGKAQLNNLISQMTTTAGRAGTGITVPLPGQSMGGQQGQGGGLWDWAKSLIGGESSEAPAQGAPQGQMGGAQVQPVAQGQGDNSGYDYNSDGTNVRATDAEVNRIANRPIHINPSYPISNDSNAAPTGSDKYGDIADAYIAKNFPTSDIGIKAQARLDSAKKSAEINSTEMNNLEKEATADSQSGFNMSLNSNKFKKAYDAAFVKGWLANLPGGQTAAKFDEESRTAMNAASNAAVDAASKLFGNRQSDYREKLAQSLKYDITMPKGTVNSVYSGINAETQRLQEHSDFVQAAKQYTNDANKIRNAWFDYNRDKPFYDPNSRKTLTENLNSFPEYLKNKFTGNNKAVSSSPVTVRNIGGTTFHKINGQWRPYLGDQ